MVEGENATVLVEFISKRRIPLRNGKSILEVTARDETGILKLKWFHTPYSLEAQFLSGRRFFVAGRPKVSSFGGPLFEILHPEITWVRETTSPEQETRIGRIVPVYIEIEGLSTHVIRKIIWNGLQALKEAYESRSFEFPEVLPAKVLDRYQFPNLLKALYAVHFPENTSLEILQQMRTLAHQRLIYEEFFKFELLLLKRKMHFARESAPTWHLQKLQDRTQALRSRFPFSLTNGQKKSIEQILLDLSSGHPMNRLIQGDVGSGKTAVALVVVGSVLSQGFQATLMAPTEILAEQHFLTAQKFFSADFSSVLVTARTSGKERADVLRRLQQGEPLLVLGTHALLEDWIQFKNLGLVIIDEQHRFGVEQRMKLRSKGKSVSANSTVTSTAPHLLVLTATPIPRTLALTFYGDLDFSIIPDRPPHRKPIETKVLETAFRERAFQKVREALLQGRQAYWIFPLVQASEAEGFESLRSAEEEFKNLQTHIFKDFSLGLLHGQMKSAEKSEILERFKKGQHSILVSTTVVEVGVDIPNATYMVIENAERFGLSQLHQLRGRVGRGEHRSYCLLLLGNPHASEEARTRLHAMEETEDGFKLAELDLQTRGPGEFLGIRQSGSLPLKIADLVRDQTILFQAREDLLELLANDPEILDPNHHSVRSYLDHHGKEEADRLQSG